MSWLNDVFGVDKPIIAMCHFRALPGDPGFDPSSGLEGVYEQARADPRALQGGGVDAVMFSNESSLPYLTQVEPITTICMARIVTELASDLRVPFGVNVLWDPAASIDLAVATDAQFVREIFTGAYASDFGIWNTNCGAVVRHQHRVNGQHVKLIFNIQPEAAVYLAGRQLADIARSTVFNARPDALAVSGLTAGVETEAEALRIVKDAVRDVPVLANTGVRLSNVEEQLALADGAIVGTTFKQDGFIWNPVDSNRVREFMDKVRAIRAQ